MLKMETTFYVKLLQKILKIFGQLPYLIMKSLRVNYLNRVMLGLTDFSQLTIPLSFTEQEKYLQSFTKKS